MSAHKQLKTCLVEACAYIRADSDVTNKEQSPRVGCWVTISVCRRMQSFEISITLRLSRPTLQLRDYQYDALNLSLELIIFIDCKLRLL